MCGITGILHNGVAPDPRTIDAMTKALSHRGPDIQQASTFDGVSLGHARLSVIDLSVAANQPLHDGTGRYAITYNGEIYNFEALRATLASKGAKFFTKSDTEVILEAYKYWGADCLAKFNGMYAFAIWDAHERRLFIARDRMGKKPLFYFETPSGQFVFASELKALLHHPELPCDINPEAVADFLTFGSVGSHHSILRSVKKLPPASWMEAASGGTSAPKSYWDLAQFFYNKQSYKDENAACDRLEELMRESARKRLVADVPVGAFLSGGVDSSIVVASMAGLRPAQSVKTFSAGFAEKTYSEINQARATAQRLGVDHTDETVGAATADEFENILWAGDEPFADNSIVPMYYLSRLARRHVTVCLSGDGADELFAGYETYKADRLKSALGFVPKSLARLASAFVEGVLPTSFSKVSFDFKAKQFLRGMASDTKTAHQSWRRYFTRNALEQIVRGGKETLPSEEQIFAPGFAFFDHVAGCDLVDAATYVDIKTWMHDDILVKCDRSSMAHGLELRAPFLDPEIVEFAAQLPVEYKLRGVETKHILKLLYKRHFPDAGLNTGKKLGFNAPMAHWFCSGLKDVAFSLTAEGAITEWIEPSYVASLWEEHWRRRRDNSFRLFALASLGVWMKRMQSIRRVSA